MLKPILPLRPHGQHKHRVDRRHIAVQRHIATRGAADDEFAFSVFHGPPDQGAMGQDLDGLQNFANALGHLANLCVNNHPVLRRCKFGLTFNHWRGRHASQ